MYKNIENLWPKNSFNLNNFEICLILFSLSAIVQLVYFYSMPLSFTIDSYAYINGNSTVRPHGYDWFLKILGINFFNNAIVVICVQMLLVSFFPVLVFLTAAPCGRISAFIAAFISLFYGYIYTMSVQVMSETLFMFGCILFVYLLSLFHTKQKIHILLLMFICLIITSEIRQSSVPLFGGVFLTILLMFFKLKKVKILFHALLVIVVFLLYSSIRPMFNDKNGLDLMPFFLVHWIVNIDTKNWEISGHEESFSPRIIDKNNGKKSQEFIVHLKKMLIDNQNLYVVMSSLRSPTGSVLKQRPQFKIFNEKNVDFLIDDIIYNRKFTAHRWPVLVTFMWEIYGVKQTTKLLRNAIIEGILKNPLYFEKFYIPAFLQAIKSGQVLHDNVYWWFIPQNNKSVGILDQFPLSPSSYASWLFSLEAKTGNDPIAKKAEGGVLAYTPKYNKGMSLIWSPKMSQSNPYESYKIHKNLTAPTIYISSYFTRTIAILLLLSLPFLAIFSLFCKQKEIVIPILGSVILIIGISFFVALAPRQIFIHIPLLFAVFGMALAGFNNIILKLINIINLKLKII